MEAKTWAEIKKYIDEVKDDLGEGDWGEIRFLVKKMSAEERGKMLKDYVMQDKHRLNRLRKEQIEKFVLYQDKDFMEELKKKQRESRDVNH